MQVVQLNISLLDERWENLNLQGETRHHSRWTERRLMAVTTYLPLRP